MTLKALVTAAVAIALTIAPGSALAASPRASLTDIENDVMCVSCHEPLAVAQSPQAYAERNFIRQLIAQDLSKKQIEHALLAQYGTAVLAKPPAHGFNLTVYVLPPAIVILGLAALAFTLPRWRRRARTPASSPAQRLDPADAQRLNEDLGRYPG